jgi:rhamnose utilization protein RhaD (predicted bifunctional aldolase and dehydrogenase)/NAD(P)-dependent dehydrogenase (short-subunit alcohol dehydrogenase family)
LTLDAAATLLIPMRYLEDLWNDAEAERLRDDPLELLRYRSNLLGADLRITNFGGGNTSSKFEARDPFTGAAVEVLAVKGSGGDLGSISRNGFALLYMERLLQLKRIYRGEAFEDEMAGYYPLAAFGANRVPASIDTPLHAYLPFPHVDHLHPDWAIALAASRNGREKLAEYNRRFAQQLIWVPWQRPGFELALMLQRAVEQYPDSDGIVLGGHGLFTWGATPLECYVQSLSVIDRLGEFVTEHVERAGDGLFGGALYGTRGDADEVAAAIFPVLRGLLGQNRRVIGDFSRDPEVMRFVNSRDAAPLASLGTSCPDHFIRTKICPLRVEWDPESGDIAALREAAAAGVEEYRRDYEAYYRSFADADSPGLRDPSPAVVLIPGVGMFTFGKDKAAARVVGEFYRNAIGVMAGATALGEGGEPASPCPQARRAEETGEFASHRNYVALPRREAFRIEYWPLEEAKLRRLPPEKELSRRVFVVAGAASGIGLATARRLAQRGAQVVLGDLDEEQVGRAAEEVAAEAGSKEAAAPVRLDVRSRPSIDAALRAAVLRYGGVDGIVITAGVFPAPGADGRIPDEGWDRILAVNVTGNYLLVDAARSILADQGLPASIVLTSSANAVVPKRGSEAYDISKSAVNHLVRELAVGLAPLVRVNAIAPATVVEGSSMFPRDRVIASLARYEIPFRDDEPTDRLRARLVEFYAGRTLTRLPITPEDCAEAICWLAGDRSGRTTGHVLPVDGGLVEAFLR